MTFFDDFGTYDSNEQNSHLEVVEGLHSRSPLPLTERAPSKSSSTFPARRSPPSAFSTPEQTAGSQSFRRRAQLIVRQGQLWEIQQGFIKALTWDEQGCVLTLGVWGPGESVGLPLGKIAPYHLLCITAVRAKPIQLDEGYPYEFLWNQAQQTQELLSLFRCRCLENRLLDMLWWLAGRFGKTIAGDRSTGIPLTHQELADLLGSTRVTMTRMLRQLEEAGKLERLVGRQFLLKGKSRHLGLVTPSS